MNSSLIFSLCLASVLAASANAQIQVQLGEVHRSADDRLFSVEIKISGENFADVEFMRTVVKTAVDGEGHDLIYHEGEEMRQMFDGILKYDLITPQGSSGQPPGLTSVVDLKNPARKAGTIKELSGEVDLIVPKHDPDSIVKVENFQKLGGKPIMSSTLRAAGIELITYNRGQAQKAGLDHTFPQLGHTPVGGYTIAVPGDTYGKNVIVVQIKDPNQKLVELEFQDADGHEIKHVGGFQEGQISEWSYPGKEDASGKVADVTKIYPFHSELPDTTRLVIQVATPKSIIKVPFSFENVALL